MITFKQFLPIVLSFFLAILFIDQVLMKTHTDFEDAGLGEGTAKYTPVKDGVPIHVTEFSGISYLSDSLNSKFLGFKNLLWLGNSQLHGVNQLKQGDKNAVEYLYDSLLHLGIRVSAFSLPNANLQEHYAALRYLSTQIKLTEVILPVFFDDTREAGIRADLVRSQVRESLPKDSVGELGKANKLAFVASVSTDNPDEDMSALKSTTQEKVEFFLNEQMNRVSRIWDSRAYLRSVIIYDYIFKTRNAVFGIKPDSKRRMIPARYSLNMEAFRAIALFCKQENIKLLVYIPPIRDDVDQPYYAEEYERFKEEIAKERIVYGYELRNYEKLVPAAYWGVKRSTSLGGEKLEVDFMHFQSKGHELLAKEIMKEFTK